MLAECKGEKGAIRYAICGLGDMARMKGEEAFVAPRGCGHKLCPRCGRRRGGKYARRILGWMANAPHGDLWVMCLTQPVRADEDIAGARKRMAPKQRDYMRWLSRRGMSAAMTTVHAIWSAKSNGWHYHTHILVELPGGSMTKAEMLEGWAKLAPDSRIDEEGNQCRMVLGAGGVIAELAEDAGDADMWSEVKSAVGKAVQYPLRDMVQGITAWRLGGNAEQLRECARQLVQLTSGWKMFRAWGNWRKACPAAVAEEGAADEEEATEASPPAVAKSLGSVSRLWRQARKGDREAMGFFRLLETGCRNDSDFAKRLVTFCRRGWGSDPPS